MFKLWPFKVCKISSGLYGGSHVEGQSPNYLNNIQENLHSSEAYVSKTFDLNDIKFGRVVRNASFYNISKIWTTSS